MARSEKAEREELRERLRGEGEPVRQIAGEMQRTFGDRPRRAWRAARGWTQSQAVMAFRTANPGAPIDEARLSRWEGWPYSRGAHPSLEDLTRLAQTFGHDCTVTDLLDDTDRKHLPQVQRDLLAMLTPSPSSAFSRPQNTLVLAMAGDPPAPMSSGSYPPRQVSAADVAAMNVMAEAFAQTDHQLGGGHASATVGHYLQHAVMPALEARGDDAVGRSLLVAAGRLHDLAGFMSFDAEQHDVAQRHFARALGLARAAEDDALTAHILGDMTMQAIHTNAVGQALALSDGAVSHAQRTDSPRVLARAHALAARARACVGDAAGADAMMTRAERVLDRTAAEDDPPWIRFFSAIQLQTEFLYAACALGRLGEVDRLAPVVLVSDAAMQRRHVLAGAAIAGALTTESGRGPGTEPDRAVDVLTQILPTVRRLSSPRSLASVASVRARLGRFGALPGLEALDHVLTQETIV